ncbi:protein gp37 [Methylophilus rhizosphaerae]|uniref:Protein gp37 n=1 Tax=Methylophilus rhizosphaerae TaxID=492660 RepID=A0A1G9CQ47_9PROT|nr:phage Gp37/Gp68 family protein [Methylophilus rhizosphaerae]SDK53772.1 protein gp37 [Methylophilus rhizosphaerae]
MSKIEWTELTWNPVVGCTKISPGCKHCYAETMAGRLKAMGTPGYENGFTLTLLPNRLNDPLNRKKPTVYFVNSMSDLFHENVPFEFIDKVFETINKATQHQFQILTKRAERLAEYFSDRTPPENAWIGVSVEDKKYGVERIDHLRKVPAQIRFLSVEPLLEDVGELNLEGIHWVIVGGESGPNARPMQIEWVESIRDQCDEAGVAFFFKQWGGWGADGKRRAKSANGRELRGRTWDEMPVQL